MKNINVIKASGKREPFSEKKLMDSVRRAGIPKPMRQQVIDEVKSILYDNIPTSKIYDQILQFFDESAYPAGKAKYSLKQAIMRLGPSGYPFEKYLAEVLKERGYKVEIGPIWEGKCARHEIDVLAQKETRKFLIECKFHNRGGIKSDIKLALYLKARYDDLMAAKDGKFETFQPWLATNTKFTRRAIKYCECAKIRLLGWNYPQQGSLRDWVSEAQLYPITVLYSLTKSIKKKLLEKGIVLCRDLVKADRELLHSIGLSKDLIIKSKKEASLVWQNRDDTHKRP